MIYPKKELAQLVVEYCAIYGIEHVIISPGSRNAPLTLGFVNHFKFKTYSIVDERCAAFFALGIAQQTRKPVAVVCTSGSAVLNYYPAVAEAFYSSIPFVIISADRPQHLIDIGDGQTIRQEHIFVNHSLYNAHLYENNLKQNSKELDNVLKVSILQKGPVHINVPFDEPLYEVSDKLSVSMPKMSYIKPEKSSLSSINLNACSEVWKASKCKMILVGELFPNKQLQDLLEVLAKDTSLIILTETTSNLYHNQFINSIDKLIFPLDSEEFESLKPDLLITFGGMVISKKIKQYLRKYPPKEHWHIDTKNAPDTYHCLSKHIKTDPDIFLSHAINQFEQAPSSYKNEWLELKEKRGRKHSEYLKNVVYSDFKTFDILLKSLPEYSQLQLSNSSVIRYTQLFDLKKSLKVFCNRGTSGIDGSTSTAIGASVVSNEQVIFITGDLSFFYDSNALWNNYIPSNFKIILINNSGGGIFKIIPGPSESNASEYFETSHQLDASHLCKMYDFQYQSAKDLNALETCLQDFYTVSEKPKLLEIFTPRELNGQVLKDYFKFIK